MLPCCHASAASHRASRRTLNAAGRPARVNTLPAASRVRRAQFIKVLLHTLLHIHGTPPAADCSLPTDAASPAALIRYSYVLLPHCQYKSDTERSTAAPYCALAVKPAAPRTLSRSSLHPRASLVLQLLPTPPLVLPSPCIVLLHNPWTMKSGCSSSLLPQHAGVKVFSLPQPPCLSSSVPATDAGVNRHFPDSCDFRNYAEARLVEAERVGCAASAASTLPFSQ